MKIPLLTISIFSAAAAAVTCSKHVDIFPRNRARGVNPDTNLVIKFTTPPTVGTSGMIYVYDAADWSVVDSLNMSIPASPNPSGRAAASDGSTTAPRPDLNDTNAYQVNIIGGVDFHFNPIIVRDNTATIYLHNNKLQYGRSYVVKMDPEVLEVAEGFKGFKDRSWTFKTKAHAPRRSKSRVVVASDGSGDFNTVQGALDWAPATPDKPITIFIKNGHYEELVYAQNKSKLVIRGQSRNRTTVGYPNNSAFNPSGRPGPSRRPAFSLQNVTDIQLSDFTIKNYFIGQAEALLVRGERVIVDHMTLNGSGDAFTTYGTIYFVDSLLTGDGDTVLGYAAIFWHRSEIQSIGPVTWTRTPEGSHGNVFLDSRIIGLDKPLPWSVTESNPDGQKVPATFARLPRNNGGSAVNFPYAEMVLLNTKTSLIDPSGWGAIEPEPSFNWTNVRFWEYNTMDLQGNKVDMSMRHPISKELLWPLDSETIENYSKPEFVLNGWKPRVVREKRGAE
ncbi:hypothetical protein jhhlp_000764 [Lomentospora prolificans]|uniref:pectinesterase n=1 Tax=Lomentospora prolificans TaxID=41688 RepID=A0A2N3NJC8_9PEZI|nr:hypothetical protein jhhlp_000764 [Lomentospora prolificans]